MNKTYDSWDVLVELFDILRQMSAGLTEVTRRWFSKTIEIIIDIKWYYNDRDHRA